MWAHTWVARDANRTIDEMDGNGSHADALTGHEDAHSVKTDTLKPTDTTEIISTHPIKLKWPNSPVEDVKHAVDETDGIGSHTGVPSIHTDAIKPVNIPQNVRMHPNRVKPPDLPSQSATLASDEPNACRHHSGVSSTQTDTQSVQTDVLTPANMPEIIRRP